MSPEKARVFLAEDDQDWQKIISEELEKAGHTVVLRSTTFKDAIANVDLLGQCGIDVAVLDGNLSEDEHSGREGRSILQTIRQKAPRVRTVGMSGISLPGTDVDLGKAKASEIGNVVTRL